MERTERLLMGLGYAWGIFWLVIAILLFPGFAKGEEKEIRGEFLITGYTSGEFAVKGPIEDQVMKEAKEIKEKIGDRTGRLQVVLIGSADTTGTGPTNDKLARDRAVEVAATLAPNFPPEPETKFIPRSRGDAENKKQVRGKWSFTPIPTPTSAPTSAPVRPATSVDKMEKGKEILMAWGMIGVIAVLVITIGTSVTIGILRRRERRIIVPEIETRDIDSVDEDNVKYRVPSEHKKAENGKWYWYVPFKTLEDPTKSLFREDFQKIKQAVRQCMKDKRYAAQKRDLITREIITKSS